MSSDLISLEWIQMQIEDRTEIICLQKEAIDELFKLLSGYMTADELDGLPCIKKINLAAKIYARL